MKERCLFIEVILILLNVSLIEYCGYGVAMENAVDEVKERANYITLSNNDNGIAYCLKQLEEKGLI